MVNRRKTKRKTRKAPVKPLLRKRIRRWVLRAISVVFLVAVGFAILGAVFNPPTTIYMFSEGKRLGGVKYEWVDLQDIAPAMARSAVAAEDANYCNHWGFDMQAIRLAIAQGSARGASTISQQAVKNVYFWHGRSWVRKAMETLMTPIVEAVWSKRRII